MCVSPKMVSYSKDHSSDIGSKKKKLFHKFTYCYTSMPIYGLKFQNLGFKKDQTTFDISQILKNLHFFGPANGQLMIYSKIQNKVCRRPSTTPMN